MSFLTMTQLYDNANLKRDIFRDFLIPSSFIFIALSLKKRLNLYYTVRGTKNSFRCGWFDIR